MPGREFELPPLYSVVPDDDHFELPSLYSVVPETPPAKKKRRRDTLLNSQELRDMWADRGADVCVAMSPKLRSQPLAMSTGIDFGKVSEAFPSIIRALYAHFDESFPGVFHDLKLELTCNPPNRAAVKATSKSLTSARRSSRVAPRKLVPEEAPTEFEFMRIRRTDADWRKKALNDTDKKKLAPLVTMVNHILEVSERFGICQVSWKLTSKQPITTGPLQGGYRQSGHVMPVVIDVEKARGRTSITATIIDINGVGLRGGFYRHLNSRCRPTGGPNGLLNVIFEKAMAHVATQLDIEEYSVEFPEFQNMNTPEVDTSELDAWHGLDSRRYVRMSDGICTVATLFVIVRLMCDQRRVFKTGIDAMLTRFIGDLGGYNHVIFIRSFTYSLLKYLGLASAQNGITGEEIVVRTS